jgi:hypothetical protein
MLREFLNLKQGSDTIPVFLLTLESKKKELKEKCKYTVDDDLQMLVLCEAVRKEYAQKLDVVKLKDTYTYEDMKKALISEDIRLRQQPGQALQARSRPKDIVCYACGEKGHKRPDCKASQAQKDAYRKKWLASKQRSPKSTQSTNEGKSAICFSASSYLQGKLLYDSGATDHVVTDPKFIHNLQKSTLMSIKAAGDEVHRVCGMGDILLQPEGKDVVTIRNVHLVPTFVCNLISGPSLDKAGAVIRTQNGLTEVYTSTGQIAFTAPLHNNQYVIQGQLITAPCPDVEGRALPASGELWYRRVVEEPAIFAMFALCLGKKRPRLSYSMGESLTCIWSRFLAVIALFKYPSNIAGIPNWVTGLNQACLWATA